MPLFSLMTMPRVKVPGGGGMKMAGGILKELAVGAGSVRVAGPGPSVSVAAIVMVSSRLGAMGDSTPEESHDMT